VFAGEAFVQCPLTTDYSAAKLFLRAVDPAAMPQQGPPSRALCARPAASWTAAREEAPAKAVLLITDGEDNQGDAGEAAKELGDAGIHLYAVAVGSERASRSRWRTQGERDRYQEGPRRAHGAHAHRHGGAPRADRAGRRSVLTAGGSDLGVAAIADELEKLEKGELESRLAIQYDDRYAYVAWPAFLLLCAAAALGEGRLRRGRAHDRAAVSRSSCRAHRGARAARGSHPRDRRSSNGPAALSAGSSRSRSPTSPRGTRAPRRADVEGALNAYEKARVPEHGTNAAALAHDRASALVRAGDARLAPQAVQEAKPRAREATRS